MSDFYDDLAATAHELLEEFGGEVTLQHALASTYNPATGTASPVVENHTGVGVKVDYAERDIDGAKIKRGDQRVYLSVVGMVAPATDDVLLVKGRKLTVVVARVLEPGDTAVLYDVQVRGIA